MQGLDNTKQRRIIYVRLGVEINYIYMYHAVCVRPSVVSSRAPYIYRISDAVDQTRGARAAPLSFFLPILFYFFFAYVRFVHHRRRPLARAGTVAITSTHCAAVTHGFASARVVCQGTGGTPSIYATATVAILQRVAPHRKLTPAAIDPPPPPPPPPLVHIIPIYSLRTIRERVYACTPRRIATGVIAP